MGISTLARAVETICTGPQSSRIALAGRQAAWPLCQAACRAFSILNGSNSNRHANRSCQI